MATGLKSTSGRNKVVFPFERNKPAKRRRCVSSMHFTKYTLEKYTLTNFLAELEMFCTFTAAYTAMGIYSNIGTQQGVANIRIFEYIQIFSGTNIHSYHIRIIFLMRIYSDIHSYCFFDTNIFGYSFVSFFLYKYIRIFVRIVF